MASVPTAFDCFTLDLGKGVHNFSSHAIYAYLTNNTPNRATHRVLADLAGLSTGGGYTSGGITIGALTWAQVSGLATLAVATDPFWTASSPGIGPFQWVVLYNFTAASKNLIAYVDIGAPITTPSGQVFTIDLVNSGILTF